MVWSFIWIYARKRIIFVVLILIFISGSVVAKEVVIPQKAPDGIEVLVTLIKDHTAPKNEGRHGLVEYCYKSDNYIVYSNNSLGYGYQLSESKPLNLKCVQLSTEMVTKNKRGMYIGMSIQEVQKLVGNIQLNERQDLIWQSKVMVNGINFDLQTYAEFKFRNSRLVWLAVFTTETN